MSVIYAPQQLYRLSDAQRESPGMDYALDRAGSFDRGWRSAGLAEEGNALADEALKAGIRGDVAERERLRGLSQAKLQEAASWAPEVKTTADIDGVQSGLQWAAGGLGSGLRSTLPSAAGGLAGATAALLTRGRVSPVVGGMLGGGYPAYAMEQEEAAGEALHDPRVVQRNTDEEILRASRLKGAITALPEVALPAIVGGKVVGQGAKALTGSTPLRHIGAQTLKGGAVEGGTEYAQALVGQATQNELRGDPMTDFDQRAALEEAAVGALVGKTLGAAGGVADVGHHKLVKPAVHVGKEIKKDPLGKVVDTIVDTGGKLGTAASKAKHGIEDYLDEREARKTGMSYEELMLSRMPDINPAGKSQEQLEAELQADDAQRMAAASVLAQRLAANPDASPALRQAAADFDRRTQQGDPTAYEALSGVLRDERTKRDVREELLNNISSWLDSKGFKLPPERRGSAMTPGGEDIEAKVKQLWLQKHSHLSGAYNTTFPDDDTARISADAVFEWVKRGFPNFNAAARGLATVWGKEAPLVVKDAHDYMVAEGLTQRAERLDEVLKKLEMVAGGKMQRLKLLGELVRPSEQERMTTVDLAAMDRLLDQFALGKIKNLGSFNEHMERVFGGRKDEALALYERLNQDELIEDTGADDRRDEADADEEREAQLEGEAQDWNSGVQEKPFPTEYRGMRGENSAGYDTLYAEAKTALNDAVREARSKGEQASAVGAWDRAQRESEGDENVLKNKEDDLIARYGGLLRSADIKQRASEKGIEADAAARELLGAALDDYAKVQGVPVDQVRDSMLRALNRRVRFVAVNAEDRIDSVDMTSADVSALKVRYKDDSKKYGVLVFEKLAAEQQVEQIDAETGEVRKLAVMQPLKKPQEWTTTSRKLIGFIRKAKNLDAGESFGAAQQLEQLYAGISSLFETGMFSGRVGYRNEAGGEVTWMRDGSWLGRTKRSPKPTFERTKVEQAAQLPADFPLAGEATVADAKKAAAEKRFKERTSSAEDHEASAEQEERAELRYAETAEQKNDALKRFADSLRDKARKQTARISGDRKTRAKQSTAVNRLLDFADYIDAERQASPGNIDAIYVAVRNQWRDAREEETKKSVAKYVVDSPYKDPNVAASTDGATALSPGKEGTAGLSNDVFYVDEQGRARKGERARRSKEDRPVEGRYRRPQDVPYEQEEMDAEQVRKEDAKPRTHDELTGEPLHPATRVEAKEVDTTQSDYVLDLLRKGMPAFNAKMSRATAEQRAKIKALIERMLNSMSDLKAKVWGKTPPKDAEQFARRARLALRTLEGGGERRGSAMTPDDRKAQVRQLIKDGKIEEAKSLSKEAPKLAAQIREAKPGALGSKENPHSVLMYYPASPDELRPALRKKYAGIKKIAELIASGDRTGTTRNPQQGVLPGHYVTFPGVPGLYRVTGFEKIDLNSPEGIAKWEEREGWDRSATKQRFAGQVEHGKLQMVFERAEEPSQQLRGAASAETQPVERRGNAAKAAGSEAIVDVSSAPAFARAKEAAKAAGADYVMAAEGVVGSYASRIAAQAKAKGKLITAENINEVKAGDVVYVSVPGASRPFTMKDSVYGLVPALLDRGAVVRADTNERAHSTHNRTGEGAIYDRLKALGYEVTENQHYAEWKKPAKPSAQHAVVSEPLTDEQKQAIEDELVKTVNLKPVWAKLIQGTDGKPWSGDWTPDMIRIAIAAADPMGVARHESIHQFFHLLRKNGGENVKQVLERLSQNSIIRKRLEELLADHPAAIKQLSDPEEFAAYAYQFWRAERLELGPKTEGFFQRVWNALKEILGLVQKQVKDAQHAEQILQAFSEGKVAAEPDVVIQALEKDAKAHNQRMENMRVLLRDSGLHQALRKAVFTAEGTLDGYGIEALTKARKLFNTSEGDAMGKQSFFEAKAQETAKRLNQLRDILNGGRRYINGEWRTTDTKPTKKDIELLSEALRARKRPNDAIVGRMYDSVQQYLKEMHAYLVGAKTARWDEEAKQWVPMGEIKDYVMPQVWDVEKIMENPQLVVDRLMKKHLPVLEKIAQEAGGAKPENIAQAIVQRIIASAGAKDLEESTMDIGMTPYMRSVNKRTLNWIDAEAFAEFMQKDVVNILSSYTVQAVKRAEYVRRFDNGGTKLSALADEALIEVVAGKGEEKWYKAKLKAMVKDWAKNGQNGDAPTMRDALGAEKGEEAVVKGLKHLDPAFKALMAMEGTLGYDIDPRVRQLMSGVTTYQNLRLLWLAIFSSFGDPLGIVVRGGEMKDAWNAFARGVREVRLRWKNEHSTDDLARLAEQLGTVDAGSFLDALGQTYSSVFMYGKFKTINDALFKWNGMEAWNRAMRIQATGAAVGFIKEHLTKPNEHSERYLKQELGLDPAQKGKWLTKDGELDYSRDEVKTAVMRWVDGAILRPNAAQRPVYASDPHYALFYHLKQFVYSFHKTILKRAYVEAQHGNWSPAAALVVAYVPVLIAADLAKELLLPDDDPPWMKQGFGAAVSHGFWRANLLGVPGLGLEAYRREDASSLLGPQIDQFADLVSVPFSERRTALGEGLGALPGGSVWRRMAD